MTATMTRTQVQIDRKPLVAALNRVGGAIPRRTNKPVLECVHLHTSGGVLHLGATDMDVSITTAIVCDGELPACVVRFRDLLGRVKSSKAASCSLCFDEDRSALVVNGGRVEHVVNALDTAEYPPIESEPTGHTITIPSGSLRSALKTCLGVAARENTRYAINGVLLESNALGTRLVATDGRRMAVVKMEGAGSGFVGGVILPVRFASLVAKLADPKRDDVIEIFIDEQPALDEQKPKPATLFACGTDWMLTSQAVEGNFPSYRDVIPKAGSKFVVNRGDLVSLVNEVSAAADSLNRSILLRFAESSLSVSTSSSGCGQSSGLMDAVFDGGGDEAIVVGVNPEYLLDAVKSLASEEIVVDVRQNTLCQRTNSVRSSPLCIRERESDSMTHVVMPVNLALPPSLETLGSNCAALAS